MDLRLACACHEFREGADGKIDILGLFDSLLAPGFPAMQEKLTVVFVIEWSAGERGRRPLRADLVHESGQKVLTIEGHTDVEPPRPGGGPAHTRLVMPLEEVIFPEPGRYTFELSVGDAPLGSFSLHLLEDPNAG